MAWRLSNIKVTFISEMEKSSIPRCAVWQSFPFTGDLKINLLWVFFYFFFLPSFLQLLLLFHMSKSFWWYDELFNSFFFFFLPDWLLEWHWQASVGPEWKCSVQWQLSDGEQDGSRDDHYGIVPLSFLCFYLVSVVVWKQWKWIRQRRKKIPIWWNARIRASGRGINEGLQQMKTFPT